jgi:hypothetical protein
MVRVFGMVEMVRMVEMVEMFRLVQLDEGKGWHLMMPGSQKLKNGCGHFPPDPWES